MRHLLASRDLGNHPCLNFINGSLVASKKLVIIIGLIIRFLVRKFVLHQPPSWFLWELNVDSYIKILNNLHSHYSSKHIRRKSIKIDGDL